MKWNTLFFIIISLLCSACTKLGSSVPNTLEYALQQAGENRKELEKVLKYYRYDLADSLKYKAACFLIENMPYYQYWEGQQCANYLTYYKLLKENIGTGTSSETLSDSIRRKYGSYKQPEQKHDILEIDSGYLCNNIEWAFKVWHEQPWGKNINFDMFCEYILPYRIEDEKLSYWREEYYLKYNEILDPLRNSDSPDRDDPMGAVRMLIQHFKGMPLFSTSTVPATLPHVGPEYAQYLTGTCQEFADFVTYLCRSLGIPCAINSVAAFNKANSGHVWNSFWDKHGEKYAMIYFPNDPAKIREDGFLGTEKMKVFHHTFSLNRDLYERMHRSGEKVLPFWEFPHFKDVTFEYTNCYLSKMTLPVERLYRQPKEGQNIYLCCSDRSDWKPLDCTQVQNATITFCELQKGALMRAATYRGGRLDFITDPFYLDPFTNDFHFYSGSEQKREVVLYAKYNLDTEEFLGRVINGVFEGSNYPDFHNPDTLYIIQERPNRLMTKQKSCSDKKYRYVRYYGSAGTHCNISEVAFYGDNDTIPLIGKIIGTPGCFQGDGSHEYTNVFDGKTWTSFDYKEGSGGWSGLDLGSPMHIHTIVYTPRNRDNYIRPGDEFELFYLQKEWHSVGTQIAKSDSLVYTNVPDSTLLLLVNHTRGVQERIFTYEKDTQLWR